MLDGEVSKYVGILQGAAQGCTLSPKVFKVCINDLVAAVEAVKQGVSVGEDTVSGSMSTDDSMGDFRNTRRAAETEKALQ